MEIEQIAKELKKKKKIVFQKIGQEFVDVYCDIQADYKNPSIRKDFMNFYGINAARPSKKWKREYFRLLAEDESDIETVLKRLHKNGGKLHFSFATKLIHTSHPHMPLFDSQVEKVLGKEFRMSVLSLQYKELMKAYARLLRNKGIKSLVSEFHDKYDPRHKMSDEKVLDSLMWGLGKTMK